MTLANRIREARKFLRLTQAEFAAKTGVSERSLQGFERGRGVPSGETLLKIAELGLNPGWLLIGTGNMLLRDRQDDGPAHGDLDRELMGRVVDAITRLYRDLAISLSPVDLGRLSAEKYAEIAAASSDPAERMAMVKLMAVQLRKELLAPPQADARKDRA